MSVRNIREKMIFTDEFGTVDGKVVVRIYSTKNGSQRAGIAWAAWEPDPVFTSVTKGSGYSKTDAVIERLAELCGLPDRYHDGKMLVATLANVSLDHVYHAHS